MVAAATVVIVNGVESRRPSRCRDTKNQAFQSTPRRRPAAHEIESDRPIARAQVIVGCFRPRRFLDDVWCTFRDTIRGKLRVMSITDNLPTLRCRHEKRQQFFATKRKTYHVAFSSIPSPANNLPCSTSTLHYGRCSEDDAQPGAAADGARRRNHGWRSWGGRPRSVESSSRRCSTRLSERVPPSYAVHGFADMTSPSAVEKTWLLRSKRPDEENARYCRML